MTLFSINLLRTNIYCSKPPATFSDLMSFCEPADTATYLGTIGWAMSGENPRFQHRVTPQTLPKLTQTNGSASMVPPTPNTFHSQRPVPSHPKQQDSSPLTPLSAIHTPTCRKRPQRPPPSQTYSARLLHAAPRKDSSRSVTTASHWSIPAN
ncbi:hypothetical protein BU16DRAFT_223518 [Lophium mytilinum]|uniref:Uncharacterized protein n=1 Tax=Lophium mytilinum TaxID=390894 RepID=A0A6A6Q8I4_9PEZI|nr:hypothetical protein BU16DRAFT_223518 [Lophium mytilinum]